jgi:uncharacterized FlaG/YvyC family protein
LKSVSTQNKAEISEFEAQMGKLSEKIRSGYEHRNVKCTKNFDYRLGTVTITRLDTGEIIRERPMDEHEKQIKLKLGQEENRREAVNP